MGSGMEWCMCTWVVPCMHVLLGHWRGADTVSALVGFQIAISLAEKAIPGKSACLQQIPWLPYQSV
jgi:hypothetical protein